MNVFTDPSFDKACGDDISYGFFGRTGGVSEGKYSSLNCGTGSEDNQDHIAENRIRIVRYLTGKDGDVSTLFQCHSADCLTIDAHVPAGDGRPQADALVTDKAGLVIGCLTADCGPVLFAGQKPDGAPVIGAAHAGWGGALKGVLENTIEQMQKAGALLDSIKACVGPCIMQASYEVSEDFMRPFAIKHEEAEHFFKSARREGHLMFDLPGYIAMRLSLAGVRHVSLMELDTYKDEENFYSYRRATHRNEGDYGRQISALVIRE